MRKNLRTPMSLTALVGLSLSVAPTGAFAAESAVVDTTTSIGAYWEKNKDALGAAVENQECFTNGACEQVFEKGVVTNGKWGGVQAIMGEAGTAFSQAGGAEKFGNAEGQPWKHTFCGNSITTHDGKTRWLVVLDSKTQAGSYLDLNSEAGKQWKIDRMQTRACFPNNVAAAEQPAPPVTEVEEASNKIADVLAIAQAHNVAVAGGQSAPVKVTEDLYAQDFGNNISGLYSASQDRALMISTDALAYYLADPARYGTYLYMNEYVQHDEGVQVQAFFYSTADQNCSNTDDWRAYGSALYTSTNGEAVMHQTYVQNDSYTGECINYDNMQVASPLNWAPQLMDRTPGAGAVDASYDWSKAEYIAIQQVLELRVSDTEVVYIKAGADRKPLPGATPVKSSALVEAMAADDRGRFSAYSDWANGGSYNIWNSVTMLGAPLAEATESTANGDTIVTQAFEGGTLVWYKGTPHAYAELNELGQAKQAWYDSLR